MEHATPAGRCELIIDLTKLPLIQGNEVHLVAEFIHRVRAQRGDYLSDVITLRSGDLEALALTTRLRPDALLDSLGPAIRQQVDLNQRSEQVGPTLMLP